LSRTTSNSIEQLLRLPFHIVNSIYLEVVDQLNKENGNEEGSGKEMAGASGMANMSSMMNQYKNMIPTIRMPSIPSIPH
jgi:hypothetical protein